MKPSAKDSQRSGASVGDILVLLSILTLGLVLVYPRLQERAFEQQLDGAVSAIETLRAASSAFLNQNRDWPGSSPAGVTPPELVSALPPEYRLAVEGYALEWNRWEIIDRPEIVLPPEPEELSQQDLPGDGVPAGPTASFRAMGGLTVYSGNSALLAGLLKHYGTSLSFVRDTTWTLVIPR